jgi:hypothetical protein
MDQIAARQFLEAALPTGVPAGSFLPTFAIGHGADLWIPDRCRSVDEAVRVIARNPKHNIYFASPVHQSVPKHQRGTSDDVTLVTAFKTDIDIADGCHKQQNLAPSVEEALRFLDTFPLRPSAIVSTGGGTQVWWFIEPVHVTNKNRGHLKSVAQNFGQLVTTHSPYKVDSVFDLTRTMRIPGSINWKTGEPRPTQLLSLDPAVRYALADIEAVLPIAWPKTTRRQGGKTSQPRAKTATGREIQQLLSHIPGLGLDYDEWFKVIAAVKHELGDEGFGLLEAWTGAYCAPGELRTKWNSLREEVTNPVAVGTLRHIASRYALPQEPEGRTVSHRYLPASTLATSRKLLVLMGDRGTGKTQAIVEACRGLSILIIGHRCALLRNHAARFEADYYEDTEDLSASSRLAITFNSLPLLAPDLRSYDVILIDESEQGLAHLTADSFVPNRLQSLCVLQDLMAKAKRIVAADADATGTGVFWLRELADLDDADVDVVINTYHESPKHAMIVSNYGQWVKLIVDAIREGKRPNIVTNVCAKALDLEHYLKELFPDKRIGCITSENSKDPKVRALLDVPGCPGAADLDILITSPTVSTGVSIDVPFDATYGYFERDITTAPDAAQQLGRVRTLIDNTLWLCFGRERSAVREEDPEVLRADTVSVARKQGLPFKRGSEDIRDEDKPYLFFWSDMEAARHRSLNNFTAHLFQLLKREGIGIERIEAERAPDTMRAMGEARLDRSAEMVSAVINAPDIGDLEAELLKKGPRSETERAKLKRHAIVKLYNQQPDEAIVTEHLERHLAEGMLTLRNYLRVDVAEAVDRAEETQALPHRKHHALQARTRREVIENSGLGLDFQGALDRELFRAWLTDHAGRVTRVLGLQVTRLLAAGQEVQVLSNVLRQMGLKLSAKRPKNKPWVYRINHQRLTWMTGLVDSHLAGIPQAPTAEWTVPRPQVATLENYSLNKQYPRVATSRSLPAFTPRVAPPVA